MKSVFISKCTNLENKNELLLGHVPIELSQLKLAWWYLRNMSLGASLKIARVLFDKLQEMKEKYSHFE